MNSQGAHILAVLLASTKAAENTGLVAIALPLDVNYFKFFISGTKL